MIRELHIKNFLSLKDVILSLGKLNVLVGPNASGKSNVVRALRFLSAFVKGELHLQGFETFKNIVFKLDEDLSIEISVIMETNGKKTVYQLEILRDSYREVITINEQQILYHEGIKGIYGYVNKDRVQKTSTPPPCDYFNKRLDCSALKTPPRDAIPEVKKLSKILKSISVYSFIPSAIRGIADIRSDPVLGYHGNNIARVLLHLYLEDRRRFQVIESVLKSLVPRVNEIVPHIKETKIHLWLREEGFEDPIPAELVSDGTLRLLALILALHLDSSLVALEEPENCIHPHLLQALVDLTRKAPCQVIITTHSPYLLDHVKIDEVFVVERRDLETIIIKLSNHRDIERVKKLLEEGGTLGEAWYSGIFGGTP